MNLTVSIIINNYNYGRFLRDSIDSALNQAVPALEVIVVDDGSTDNSRAIIESYGDAVHGLFQQNQGQLSAYSSGFEASRGDLVLFLDSDDMIFPELVSEVTQAWRPGTAKLHFLFRMKISGGGKSDGELFPSATLPYGDLTDTILRTGFYISPSGSANVYSRDFLNQVFPMHTRDYRAADTVTGYLAPFYGNVQAIQKPLAWYRIHGGNDSSSAIANCKTIRNVLQNDYDRVRILRMAALQRGMTFDEYTLNGEVRHLKLRIASLRLDHHTHPHKEDTRWRLTVMGIRATLLTRPIHILWQLQVMVWFILMMFVPGRIVPYLASLGCSPGSRPKSLSKFLGFSRT